MAFIRSQLNVHGTLWCLSTLAGLPRTPMACSKMQPLVSLIISQFCCSLSLPGLEEFTICMPRDTNGKSTLRILSSLFWLDPSLQSLALQIPTVSVHPQLSEITMLCLGSPILCCGQESTQAQSRVRYETHLIHFPSSQNHSLALQENSYYIYFPRLRESLGPVILLSCVLEIWHWILSPHLVCYCWCSLLQVYLFLVILWVWKKRFCTLVCPCHILLEVPNYYFKERLTVLYRQYYFSCIYRKWNPFGYKIWFPIHFAQKSVYIFPL